MRLAIATVTLCLLAPAAQAGVGWNDRQAKPGHERNIFHDYPDEPVLMSDDLGTLMRMMKAEEAKKHERIKRVPVRRGTFRNRQAVPGAVGEPVLPGPGQFGER